MITLSVLVISHNQAHLIGRCLDSILSQKLNVDYEIVISDDASTDATWEVILDYQKKYPNIIKPFQINSSDYNPDITSDRCAINKANVYKHAKGKYVVNIDADDYLCDLNVYQNQIDLLESNLGCSICIQNIVFQKDGEPNDFSKLWFVQGTLLTGNIVNAVEFFNRRMLISNPAIMMRRDKSLDPYKRYGLLYDDFVITTHHLTLGNAICLNVAGYVYVQYRHSIWNTVVNSSYLSVRSMAAMNILLSFFPQFRYEILYSNIIIYIDCLKHILQNREIIQIEEGNRRYIIRLDSNFLNNIINCKSLILQNLIVKIYLLLFLIVSKIKLRLLTRLLYYIIK